MTSHQREQQERQAVLTGEQKLRPGDYEPSTLHAMSRLSNDLEGRASARDYVTGSEQTTNYPPIQSGPWSSDYAKLPDEPALGFSVEAVEPTGTPAEVAASIAAANLISASAAQPNGGEPSPNSTIIARIGLVPDPNSTNEEAVGGPGSTKLGNEVALNVGGGGVGTGRVQYGQSGTQAQHGPVNPGKPTPARDIFGEFGSDSPIVSERK